MENGSNLTGPSSGPQTANSLPTVLSSPIQPILHALLELLPPGQLYLSILMSGFQSRNQIPERQGCLICSLDKSI